MIGITFFRVSNPTAAPIASGSLTVAALSQVIFPEGQIGGITLNTSGFRGATSSGPAGSIAGSKAKIVSANLANVTWVTPTAASGLVLEVGTLDNDGYFSAYLSSV